MASEHNQTETTGHVWDEDLAEYNNPLPSWWIWVFYGTVVFAVVYWILYPAWPVGDTYTKGILDYSKRAKFQNTMQKVEEGELYPKRQKALQKISKMSVPAVMDKPDLMNFVNSSGKVLFGDNCAPCHGSGGQGVVGSYPNLTDNAWLYGGKPKNIQKTLMKGRSGYMPAHEGSLSQAEIKAVATYVGSLSDQKWANDPAKIKQGKKIFHGDKAACYACHGKDAQGKETLGSANLTDAIWFYGGDKKTVMKTIRKGRQGMMPAWQDRLNANQIKILTAYVHSLGGGE